MWDTGWPRLSTGALGKNLNAYNKRPGGRGPSKTKARANGPDNAKSSRELHSDSWGGGGGFCRIKSRSAWRVMGSAPWGSTDISTWGQTGDV